MAPYSVWSGPLRAKFDAAARTHFSLFFRRVMGTVAPGVTYSHNWHIDAIGAYLQACASGDITRLIINMPPRMLKSTLVSVAWPAWLLGQRADARIMAASYAQSLSTKHSVDCRAVLESEWYQRIFPDTMLRREQNEKERFATTARGHRLAVSVGGAAIGEGGDILIVDDPISPLQAMHLHQREMVNHWFDHTFVSRLDDKRKGVIVLVMQRLHKEDLCGYLLEKGGWEHLCLPAIAPERQVISIGTFSHSRETGEVLHAEREDAAMLERTKRELGSANFNAQYQQQPIHHAHALIRSEWFHRFDLDAVTH